METKRSFFNSKDRRSKSCLHRSSPRYLEGNRASSLTEPSQSNELPKMDSPITVVLVLM